MANLRPILLWFFSISIFHVTSRSAELDTYIVHMDLSVMPNSFSDHHSWFSSVLDNSKTAADSSRLIYSYNNVMHGFSARLTLTELEVLKTSPGYVSSYKDLPVKADTTHSCQFLGLSSSSGAWPLTKYGDGIIIGLVDTGIWPESESYNDDGMASVPSRWKGICENGTQFSSSLCNRKLIGASQFELIFMDLCLDVKELKQVAYNKIVVCQDKNDSLSDQVYNVHQAKAAAGIFITNITDLEFFIQTSFPAVFMNFSNGQVIEDYVKNSASQSKASIEFRKTLLGTKPAPSVTSYSSRGPSPNCPFRTVTNVGDEISSYMAKVFMPSQELNVTVIPDRLVFTKKCEKLSYKLVIEGPSTIKEYAIYGSLSWVDSDEKYVVKSPILATSLSSEAILSSVTS
ncbi:Subtilisin-like protease, fibronectin type-III domain [Dillenia turbinata]|uniref:Subtilisin-like protease, fibronectin type-III domain n=1 Tax=Dillenia turbinata TaxID=194707 RepID=A0AAN8ZJ55_9MAGN